jgi:hypothetical protein
VEGTSLLSFFPPSKKERSEIEEELMPTGSDFTSTLFLTDTTTSSSSSSYPRRRTRTPPSRTSSGCRSRSRGSLISLGRPNPPKVRLAMLLLDVPCERVLMDVFHPHAGKRLIGLEDETARSYGWTPRRCDGNFLSCAACEPRLNPANLIRFCSRYLSVYVGSFAEGLMDDRVEIVGDLWSAGLRADLMYEDAVGSGLEEVMTDCQSQGILFLVVSKGRPLLKVR